MLFTFSVRCLVIFITKKTLFHKAYFEIWIKTCKSFVMNYLPGKNVDLSRQIMVDEYTCIQTKRNHKVKIKHTLFSYWSFLNINLSNKMLASPTRFYISPIQFYSYLGINKTKCSSRQNHGYPPYETLTKSKKRIGFMYCQILTITS